MKNMRSELTSEDGNFYYGSIKGSTFSDGVECPQCGFIFVILGTDGIRHHEFKPIPCTGTTDYFCPCCGHNLREFIRARLEAA